MRRLLFRFFALLSSRTDEAAGSRSSQSSGRFSLRLQVQSKVGLAGHDAVDVYGTMCVSGGSAYVCCEHNQGLPNGTFLAGIAERGTDDVFSRAA
jgi:hypothetical protein